MPPGRGAIEKAFAWLGQAWRLAKPFERLLETGVAMIHAAVSRIMVRKLTSVGR